MEWGPLLVTDHSLLSEDPVNVYELFQLFPVLAALSMRSTWNMGSSDLPVSGQLYWLVPGLVRKKSAC